MLAHRRHPTSLHVRTFAATSRGTRTGWSGRKKSGRPPRRHEEDAVVLDDAVGHDLDPVAVTTGRTERCRQGHRERDRAGRRSPDDLHVTGPLPECRTAVRVPRSISAAGSRFDHCFHHSSCDGLLPDGLGDRAGYAPRVPGGPPYGYRLPHPQSSQACRGRLHPARSEPWWRRSPEIKCLRRALAGESRPGPSPLGRHAGPTPVHALCAEPDSESVEPCVISQRIWRHPAWCLRLESRLGGPCVVTWSTIGRDRAVRLTSPAWRHKHLGGTTPVNASMVHVQRSLRLPLGRSGCRPLGR